MWSVGLGFLLFCVVTGAERQNHSRLDDSAGFSIDEVAVLNRKFLDYLVQLDAAQAESDEDRRCVDAMQLLSRAYINRERNGLEWFDSWGKIPSGLYYGNGFAIGNYEQCQRFSYGQVNSYHCTLSAAMPNSQLPIVAFGLCLPELCSPEFSLKLYGGHLLEQGVALLPVLNFCSRDAGVKFNGALITAIVIFSIIAGLVVASTVYEVVQILLKNPITVQYASFSLYRNIRSILHVIPRQKDPAKKMDTIECANGIRALSMIWIIVHHVHETSVSYPVSNPQTRLDYLFSFVSSATANSGSLAVDAFLAMGGMLVSITMLRELDKAGKINPLMLYLRRYIRLTAPYAALILFVVSFPMYMGDGPLWKSTMTSLQRGCLENWWSALLHIQNYVNPRNMCLNWTWYLSVDMQLYILAPALIYPLWRWGKRVLIGIGGLAFLSIACVFTTFLVNDFRDVQNAIPLREQVLTYYPTHARMAAWFLGVIFGYILHRTRSAGSNLPKRYYALGWSICFAILALIIYGGHEVFLMEYSESAKVADAFYVSLSRPVFGVCVCWIIWACVNGQGGVIDGILGSELWQPLAKLSFTMYLLHLQLLLMASIANSKTEQNFSVMDLYYRIWGAIGLTTSVSLLWSAVFEVPFVTLEKVLLRK
ncbi:nose resistant to fluoxetine protein 6 [Culex quinquefasciatus]|uniref:nose resistant to fluoxetine protein 6 n=1 Tax=Culex quinquefasciatus TaxID=7176 RepID=UPI0018E2E66A|nr:nose resistant to fluoxetine protein 6 [Culex quinquefasciatus]